MTGSERDAAALAAAAPAAPAARPARRIGVLGGSFDPVHQAHLALARLALHELALDELRWVPAGQAWQKSRPLTDAAHRLAMLRAALEDEARHAGADHRGGAQVVDPIEIDRGGPSYTVDTLEALAAHEPGAERFLVIGQDQYANLPTWHRWERLLELATLAVAARAGSRVQAPPPLIQRAHRVVVLALPAMAVSATAIRAHLEAGGVAADLVPQMLPPAVAGYIDRHRLYR